jgi:hypothetical protein
MSFYLDVFKEVLENKRKDYKKEDLMLILNLALEMESSIRYSITPKTWLEFFISKMCLMPKTIELMKILENYNIVYKKSENEVKEEKPLTLKDKLLDYFENSIISGIISVSEIVEEDNKIKFFFKSEHIYQSAKEYTNELKKALNLLNYTNKEIEILLKEENPIVGKLISELGLIKEES